MLLPIAKRGRAVATATLPIVLRNFRLDPEVDTGVKLQLTKNDYKQQNFVADKQKTVV